MSHKRIVLVGGCFDLLHYGHLIFLQKARAQGDYLVVALESDQFIREKKNRQPIHTQDQRAKILTSLKCVDRVIELPMMRSDDDYFKLVKRVKPAVIAVSKNDRQVENKRKQATQVGATVKIVTSVVAGFSTSKIISSLSET